MFFLVTMERESAKRELREKIAGEITMSPDSGKTIRKWRETFEITQHDLSIHLETSPSVLSDYESGRRKSPGIATIRKIVEALIEIDEEHGGRVLARYNMAYRLEAIISAAEFPQVIPAVEFVRAIDGENLCKRTSLDRNIHGYTIVDSMLASHDGGIDGFAPYWHGWALREAFKAGIDYQCQNKT